MAYERLRAHGAAVGTIAVVVVAGVSVASLLVAQSRLEQFDHDRRAGTATAAPVEAPPSSTAPAPPSVLESSNSPTVAGPPSGLLTELFALMNSDRATRGIAPLTWDDRLSGAAQRVADAMAESGLVAHPDLDAILALGFARGAENVLTGPLDITATSAEYGWMGSTPHRSTILDTGLVTVGIGATSSPDGHIWIAVDFGG